MRPQVGRDDWKLCFECKETEEVSVSQMTAVLAADTRSGCWHCKHGVGRSLQASTSNRGYKDSCWLLKDEESDFFKGVDTGRLTTVLFPYLQMYGYHKL